MHLTRRDALRGTTATVAAIAAGGAVAARLAVDDPVIALVDEIRWIRQVWREADNAFEEAADTVGFYSSALDIDYDMITVKTNDLDNYWSRREILAAAERGDLTPKQRDQCLARVDTMQAKAAEIRRETGLDALAETVKANRDRYWELKNEICETPAISVNGILAKMRGFYEPDEEAVMIKGEDDLDDFPSEYAASIFRDLLRLTGELPA